MTQYKIVPATEEHVRYVADRLHEEDAAEVWAWDHKSPHSHLAQSLLVSRDARAGLADGLPILLWGVGQQTLTSDVGIPWALGTFAVPQHGRAIARGSREVVQQYRTWYKLMVNYVDARHRRAVRWLSWLGFTIDPAVPVGPDKVPFHRFWMETT